MRRRRLLTGWKLYVLAGSSFYTVLLFALWGKWIARHPNISVLAGLPEVAVYTAIATVCLLASLAIDQRRRGK